MFSIKLLFNKFFKSITKNLDLFEWPDDPKFNIFDKIDIIINKFWSHPKIIKLKQKFSCKKKNTFKPYTEVFFKNHRSLMIYLRMKQLVVIYHLTS